MSEPIQPRILPAKTKKEKKERRAVVKKIIVALHKKNRRRVRSLLPTTARGDIQQANLNAFLERPENEGLVNRIYSMTIGQGRFRSTEEVLADLDPITIPTIFEPLETDVEREAQIREQRKIERDLVARDEDRMVREQRERILEREEESRRAEEEQTRQIREMEEDLLKRMEGEREGKSKKAQQRRKRKAEERFRKKMEEARKKEEEKAKQIKKKVEEEKQKKFKKQLEEVEERTKQLKKEVSERRPEQVEEVEEVASLFTPEERQSIRETGLAINPSTENTANVPADPVANQRQEAQTQTLPVTRREPPRVPSIPALRLPALDDRSIEAISSRIKNPQEREVARGILKGEIDPNTIEDAIISTIIEATGATKLLKPVLNGIFRYINNKIGQRRYRQILEQGGYRATIPELTEEQRQEVERLEREAREEGIRIVDIEALEQFRNIGTPPEILERIIHLAEGENENLEAVASRVYDDVIDRAIRQSLLNDIDNTLTYQYIDDVRATIMGLAPVLAPITQDSVERAIEQHQDKVVQQERGERIDMLNEARIRGRAGVASGVVGGAVSSGLSGGMTGGMGAVAGRVLSGAGAGIVRGGLSGIVGGEVGKRVAGEKGKRVGQALGGLAAGITAGISTGSEMARVQEVPVQIPDQVVSQEEPLKSGSGKGTLRPKFIIPSASILDKTDNEIQADLDEFSAFDYVIPTSEGTEGNISNNPLKRNAYIQNELILNGGGINIPSQWGEEPMISEQEQKEQMIGDKLTPLPELKMGVVDEDISVGFYTEKAQPNLWNAGSIKLDPLYYGFTRAIASFGSINFIYY
jgi:hypothetical protein